MITVAALSPSLDITYEVDRLVVGQIHRPRTVVRCAGGKSLNMARVCSGLGADVRVVVVLGGATGEAVRLGLADAGIASDVIASPDETRTCVSIASTHDAALTEVYQYAPALPPVVWERVIAAVGRNVDARPGWLSVSGAPPPNLPPDCVAALVEMGRRAGVRTAVDTHGAALAEAVAAAPELVKVNRMEAAALLGIDPDHGLLELARAVQERTGRTVVLTDGAAGAAAVTGAEAWLARPPAIVGRYPVGSGDAFLGGMLARLDAGGDLSAALRYGVAAGTANALTPGPGLLDPLQLARIAAEVDILAQ